MNKELWEKTIELHGHACIDVALGFRMGEEAKNIFGDNVDIYCKIPSKTCIADGITGSIGASEENGHLQIDSTVKKHIFYVPDDEEGWAITRKDMDFPGGKDPVTATLTCSRDFLFMLEPYEMD